uniref:non-specific serine/threonine protein kinase n=1 Tax=Echinococcus granulosus TaxID=6210 RepID=A0A068X1M9_ECHGR|nr:serine:threonine protein kinase [Echinococcus granulosus]
MSAATSSVSAQPVDPSNNLNGLSVGQQQQQSPADATVEESWKSAASTAANSSAEGGGGAEKRLASDSTGPTTAAPPPAKRAWRDQPHVGKYKLIRTLGSGNFAKVKLAQHITTKKEVAVKVIDKGKLNHASLNKLFREVNVMKQLNHPNIVSLQSMLLLLKTSNFAFLTKYMVSLHSSF